MTDKLKVHTRINSPITLTLYSWHQYTGSVQTGLTRKEAEKLRDALDEAIAYHEHPPTSFERVIKKELI